MVSGGREEKKRKRERERERESRKRTRGEKGREEAKPNWAATKLAIRGLFGGRSPIIIITIIRSTTWYALRTECNYHGRRVLNYLLILFGLFLFLLSAGPVYGVLLTVPDRH